MATQDLINQGQTVDTSKDNVIIDKIFETIRGGRTLDVTGFAPTTISAGHVILLHPDTGEFSPQPVDGSIPTNGAATPVPYSAAGILTVSILTAKPEAAIMTRGTVNEVPLAYPINAATKTALGERIAYVITD